MTNDCKDNSGRPKSIRTENNINVQSTMMRSLRKSNTRLTLETGIVRTSLHLDPGMLGSLYQIKPHFITAAAWISITAPSFGIWNTDNVHHELREHTLSSPKVNLYCDILKFRVLGPNFFTDQTNWKFSPRSVVGYRCW